MVKIKKTKEKYEEKLEDDYFIKCKIEFYEDWGKKEALMEIDDTICKMMRIEGNYKEGENDYYVERGRKKALMEIRDTIYEMIDIMTRKFMKETADYYVADNLVEKGYLYDEFHLYVPFTYKDDENPDPEIYLAISVLARGYWGDGDIPEVFYWWCKKIGNKFKILDEYWVGLFPIDENYDFSNDLYEYSKYCGLNYDKNSYDEFAERLKEDIFNSPSLDYLKNVDSRKGRTTYQDLNQGIGFM